MILAVAHNSHSVDAWLVLANAKMANNAVFMRFDVFVVFKAFTDAQIAHPIVKPVAVDVVNLHLPWIFTSRK